MPPNRTAMEADALADIVVSTCSHQPISTTSSSSGNTDTALAEAPCPTGHNDSSSNSIQGRVLEANTVAWVRKSQPHLCSICIEWIDRAKEGRRHRGCRDLVDRLGLGAAKKFTQARRLADMDNKRKREDTNPAVDGTTDCADKRQRSLQHSTQSEEIYARATAALRAAGLTFADERKLWTSKQLRGAGLLAGGARRVSDIPNAD